MGKISRAAAGGAFFRTITQPFKLKKARPDNIIIIYLISPNAFQAILLRSKTKKIIYHFFVAVFSLNAFDNERMDIGVIYCFIS